MLSTYADLKSAIQSWMSARSDIPAEAADFIALTEADCNRALRVREMEATASLTPDADGKATLPTDYLEFRSVITTGSPRRALQLIDPMQAEQLYGYRESDDARHFTIVGSTLQVLPVSTTAVSLLYYARITALNDTDTTNWLLTKAPGAYLYGGIRYAAEWLQDFQHADRMESRFQAEIQKLNDDDKGQRYARAAASRIGQRP